ncbi:hypothetical protein GGR50DRAFT_562486 [Xylaria sp. CBS 124048]|nr:hypothetical protein GGR50DRAFT_562486 [Xylaria sp. CBS 124048]
MSDRIPVSICLSNDLQPPSLWLWPGQLDSRNQRVDRDTDVPRLDIDLSEVIAHCRQVLPTTLHQHDYCRISANATGDSWLDGIPTDNSVLVIAEGSQCKTAVSRTGSVYKWVMDDLRAAGHQQRDISSGTLKRFTCTFKLLEDHDAIM